jgi:hypothetical protein
VGDEPKPLFPTDKAVARRYKELIATSPKSMQPGQGVMLDKHGVGVGRARYGRIIGAWRIGIFATMIGAGALMATGAWIPGSILYFAGLTPALLAKYRGTSKLMAIDVIIRNGHLDAAQRRLDIVPELRRRNPVLYCTIAGNLASHRGDHAAAVTWWREAFPRSKGLRRELFKIRITGDLLLAGRIEEARREYDSIVFPPEADLVLTRQILTRAMFMLLDPSARPASSEELHESTRLALEYNHTGVDVAALGWCFERIGDDDMARFLASEALDRMHYPFAATWWPALRRWTDDHVT